MSADTTFQRCDASLPVRGAWIEMLQSNIKSIRKESLPVRGAWIEIVLEIASPTRTIGSLPVRGAWIEISSN